MIVLLICLNQSASCEVVSCFDTLVDIDTIKLFGNGTLYSNQMKNRESENFYCVTNFHVIKLLLFAESTALNKSIATLTGTLEIKLSLLKIELPFINVDFLSRTFEP